MSESRVTSRDRGYNALMKRVFGFGRPQVVVGILEADGARTKESEEGAADDLTIIQVASWMEFGFTDANGNEVPARSFIRDWFDQASPEKREQLRVLARSVLAGKRTKEQILELLGQSCVAGIQKRMADGIPPPNEPSTIAAKGSSTPLIATGQLRSAVSYAVREGDEG